MVDNIILNSKTIIVLIAFIVSMHSSVAVAGSVKLISDDWDSICKVQITSGFNAPDTSIETFTNRKKGWSITRSDKLCYRRSGSPNNCGSGYTAWSCMSQTTSGTSSFSLR